MEEQRNRIEFQGKIDLKTIPAFIIMINRFLCNWHENEKQMLQKIWSI